MLGIKMQTSIMKNLKKHLQNILEQNIAISLPSCTSAIHLSLLSLNIDPKDEVIVPDITWIASAAPITYVGAKTVFADIDPKTWCISEDSINKCITKRTKVIIPVDLYGNMPNMEIIREIADDNGLYIIEDAAQAIGSEFKKKKAGSFGDTGVFSFHGSKTLTTGEGGMLVTNNEDIYKKVLFLRDHGRKIGDKMFYNTEVAYKYKMSNLQAAMGLAQLERIEELIDYKRKIFRWYQSNLSNIKDINLNYESSNTKNTYWMVTIVLDENLGITKEELIKKLSEKNIDARPFFYPLSSLPAYSESNEAKKANKRNINSYTISPYSINLPSGFNMNEEKVEYVCNAIKSIIS